tara:strand:- start:327 stop:524 length:198 start_codon:yes stop_codon:yes gene_type:complete
MTEDQKILISDLERWWQKGELLYDLTHPETPGQYLIVTILVSILIFILYSIYHLYKESKKNKNKK